MKADSVDMFIDDSCEIKKCSCCLLPKKTPRIEFNKDGVCSYCNKHESFSYKGEDAFLSKIISLKTENNKYDAIVCISGGRDSCYTLLKTVKDFKLKILAVNYENPWTTSYAKNNILKILKKFNIDLIQIKPNIKEFEGCFRNNFYTWIKNTNISLLPMVCIPCRSMDIDIYRVARKYRVKAVITGSNPMQNSAFISEMISVDSSLPYYKKILKSASYVLSKPLDNLSYFNPKYISITAKSYYAAIVNAYGPTKFGYNVNVVALPYFIEWDEVEAEKRLNEEVGWSHPSNLTQRFDCPVSRLKDFIYWKKFKITKEHDYYAKMIREGLISKDVAEEKLQHAEKFDTYSIDQFLNSIGIRYTTAEISKIIDMN